MTKRMLIDALHPEETRVVLADNNRIHDFDFITSAKKQIKGNIYLAKITRVEPSLQAAFVEYGGGKQGFLPFAEIHPDYYQIPISDRQRLLAEAEQQASEEMEREEQEDAAGAESYNEASEQDFAQDASEQILDEAPEIQSLSDIIPPFLPVAEESDENLADDRPFFEEPDSQYQAEASDAPSIQSELVGDDEPAEGQLEAGAEATEETEETEETGEEEEFAPRRKPSFSKRYKIQEVIKRNQIVLVQVIKEERGNKGVSLTTYISLAGRYCVLMPNSPKDGGISRKISNNEDRKRLKQISSELKVSEGMSAIIRTAGMDRTRAEIKRDYDYLVKLWNNIREQTLSSTAPALIYEEGDLVKRTIRDLYNSDIEEVLVEGEEAYRTAKDFMKMILPSHAPRVKLYKDNVPLFYQYDVEEQLLSMHDPVVRLKSGGYIVLNPTEALISIDVNSGRATGERNIEETASKTNLEAAAEIARQVRLRDLAGLLVIDFIDMSDSRNRRTVERAMKDALKLDRAKIQLGRISIFGLMEMSRQRLRPSISEASTVQCSHCQGRGIVRSNESIGIQIIRALEKEAGAEQFAELRLCTPSTVAAYLFNSKREAISTIETRYNIRITIVIDDSTAAAGFKIEKVKNAGEGQGSRDRKTRGRSRTRNNNTGPTARAEMDPLVEDTAPEESEVEPVAADGESRPARPPRRRGGRRNRRGYGDREQGDAPQEARSEEQAVAPSEGAADGVINGEEKPQRSRSRGGRRRWRERPDRPDRQGQDRPERAATAAVVHDESIPTRWSSDQHMPKPTPVSAPVEAAVRTSQNESTGSENKSDKKGWWRRMVE